MWVDELNRGEDWGDLLFLLVVCFFVGGCLSKSLTDTSEESEKPPTPLLVCKTWSNGKKAYYYSPEAGQTICGMISEGMTLSQICSFPDMPSRVTIWTWAETHEEFAKGMKRAKAMRAEYLTDKALEIADQTEWKTSTQNQIKIDTAFKAASFLDRDTYGNKEKAQVENNLTFVIQTGLGEQRPIVIDTRDPSVILKERELKRSSTQALIQDKSSLTYKPNSEDSPPSGATEGGESQSSSLTTPSIQDSNANSKIHNMP